MTRSRELVGVVPAAGLATRLGRTPSSKEVLPVGWEAGAAGPPRLKVVSEYLLEAFRRAEVQRTFFVIRRGKWDIPQHLGDGSDFGLRIGYLLMGLPHGAPYTIDQAYPFVREATVALGFPDIIFEPLDAYARLLERHRASEADVTLGLFPARAPETCDMVDADPGGTVRRIEVKPPRSALANTWGIALWEPRFGDFLHERVARGLSGAQGAKETYVGEVVQAAIEEGFRVEAIPVSESPYLDIGTPEAYAEALRKYAADVPSEPHPAALPGAAPGGSSSEMRQTTAPAATRRAPA
ncbi:MAG: nucleotidyltransferase family protein [Planctomycetota bacterium]